MRIFSLITTLATLATFVAGLSLPRQDDCGFEAGCGLSQLSKREFTVDHAARSPQGLTNAELIRRGLPLKNPIMRRGTPVRRNSPSGTPSKTVQRGKIRVRKESDNEVLGYVSATTYQHAQFLYGHVDSALIVSFETGAGDSDTKLNLAIENADIQGFALGLVEGRDNVDSVLAAGSYQYTYLAGTKQTPPGSPPLVVGNSYGSTRASESALWNWVRKTQSLTLHWVNPDGSYPTVHIFAQGVAIYVGGDPAAFNHKYQSPVTNIVFEFVPL